MPSWTTRNQESGMPLRSLRLKSKSGSPNLQVFDVAGTQVDKHDKRLDQSEQSLLIVSVPPLKPGKYKVVWRVTSVDTHVTHGDFTFDVSP